MHKQILYMSNIDNIQSVFFLLNQLLKLCYLLVLIEITILKIPSFLTKGFKATTLLINDIKKILYIIRSET